MNELMLLQMSGAGFGFGVDLAAVLAFIAFAVVAFLAPVIGYQPGRPAGITASLFLLNGYVAVSLIQLVALWLQVSEGLAGRPGPQGTSSGHFLLACAVLKLGLFVAAMLSFAVGVLALQVRRPRFPAEPGADADRDRAGG